jgi:transcriptional regulator with XRE-family HTH domain
MSEEVSDFRARFCDRLRRCRRNRDRTQEDVAHVIGMTRSHYAALEGGRHGLMQLEQLATLADTLNTSTDYLLLRTDEDPGVIPPLGCPREEPSLDGREIPLPTTVPSND